ncbi:MAG: GIY-YIG nuclease family protein [Bacteroidales bacterium]|nr:GIY-YIG nuclease family protein [Bacteroidales bacterium]
MAITNELDELFDDPMFEVTETESKLFDIPADMKRIMDGRRLQPDHYAQRTLCEDFAQYRPMFEQVQRELREGRRSLVRTGKTSSLEMGHFYVVGGLLVYLAAIAEKSRASNGLTNGRTHCIFEDGTESDILLQTLRKYITGDGYGVTDTQEGQQESFEQLGTEDRSSGYIYILRSLSTNPEIAGVENLYKIGMTTNSVEERVANAVHEPTYLMAPVQIVSTAEIFNMHSMRFEALVHQMFEAVNFKVKVYDDEGQEHEPEEWYVAPLEIIELVIKKITDGSILNYTYNPELQCLEKRVVKKSSNFNTTGLKVLTLNIKDVYFKEILSGSKTIEYRELKQTTLNKYTYIDAADGKRYLRRYDVIRFYVGYHKDRDSALIEVTDITFKNGIVEYHLGRILEHVTDDRE